jgi:hypothetical protein
MRRRLPFVTALAIILVAALATGGDRLAEAAFHGPKGPPSSPMKRHAFAAYGKLPLAFVSNAGQTEARVRYSAQGAGYSVFLTRSEAVLALERPQLNGKRKAVALGLRFLGANRHAAIRAEAPGQGRVNYLLGNDPANWHTGMRTYERVVYHNLWPGVDMVFAGQNGKLKYEFLVRPGARVSEIRLAYRGAKRLSLDRQGNLRIRTLLGVLTDPQPASYQLVADKRVPVRSSFALESDGRGYSFAVESGYDHRYPLVIDPGLAYSTYLGGSGDDRGYAVTVDAAGSAYVTGETRSADFPTTPGAFEPIFNGGTDVFLTKFDASGAALAYSTYLGGSAYESGLGVSVDGAGSAYVTGSTSSANFPTTAGAYDTSYNGDYDAFATKLNASGAALVYSPTWAEEAAVLETLATGSSSMPRATPTSRATPTRRTSPPPRAYSTGASTAAPTTCS